MKLLFKLILMIFLFLISLLIFLPKEGVYNLVEKELSKQNIFISNEIRKENLFGLELNGAEIYYDGINTSFVKKIDFKTFLFYWKIDVENIRVSNNLKNMIPSKVDKIQVSYNILRFNSIEIIATGEFGVFNAEFLIFDKKLVGLLKPSSIMKTKYRSVLQQFKLEDGKYKYEQNL